MSFNYDFNTLDNSFPSIPLTMFVANYAPLLKSDDPLAFNLTWVNEVSKSVNSFVYLTNEKGETVDIVPPLSNPINLSDFINEHSLTYIADEERKDARYGVMALDQVLESIPLNINKDKEYNLVQKWRDFLKRNNIDVEYHDNVTGVGNVSNKTRVMDSDVEWEEI
jgi:hypothetical protein